MKTALYYFFWIIIRIVLHTFYRYKVYNRARIKGRLPGTLIVANHASFLDPMIIGSSFPMKIHYLARSTLFTQNAFFGWLISAVCAIPISRKRLDITTVRRVQDVCKNGGSVVIFPEGTRTSDGALKPGQAGVGFFVDKIGVPVVPMYVEGSYDAWPRHKKRPGIARIRMNIGEPLALATLAPGMKGKERYQAMADEIMRHITALRDELRTQA